MNCFFVSLFLANLLNITFGISVTWFASYAEKFSSSDSPLDVPPLSRNEIKWIDSSLYLGGFIGTILLTIAGDVFGRKNTLAFLIIPQLVRKIIRFQFNHVINNEYLKKKSLLFAVHLVIEDVVNKCNRFVYRSIHHWICCWWFNKFDDPFR